VAPPISYAVNGKQYVAVAAGPKWNAANKPASLKYANACSMVLCVYALTEARRNHL